MAVWDNISLPSGPTPPSYAAPLVDFSNIGNLSNTYFQGQAQRQALAAQNAFPQGLPLDANGQPDVNAIAQTMAKLGGVAGAQQAIPLIQGQQLVDAYSRGAPSFDTGGETAPSTQPQPQPQRQPVSVSPSGFPVQQATEGMISAVPDSGPNAGRNIAPEVNAAPVTRTVENTQTPAEDVRASPTPSALPPGVSETAARNHDRAAAYYANRANIAERLKPGSGAGDLAQSKQHADIAAEMRKTLKERGPEALQFEAEKSLQADKIKRSMKTYEGINAQASQYEADMRPYVTLSKSLLNDPAMYSGIGGQFNLDINRVRAAFGDQKAAQLQEALQKVTANTVLGQINQQRNEMMESGSNQGRMFQAQVEQVAKAAPQLATTLGGNRFLVEVQSRIGDLATKRAQMAREYLGSHRILDEGFDEKMSKWMRANPLFSSQELANPALIGAPQVPDSIAAGGGQRVASWARQMRIGPNDVIRTHDGRYVHPPGGAPTAPPGAAVAGERAM